MDTQPGRGGATRLPTLGTFDSIFWKDPDGAFQCTFKCHPQRAGQNPSTALVLLVKHPRECAFKSRVLYEYKPSIHNRLSHVRIKHLIELLATSMLLCYEV